MKLFLALAAASLLHAEAAPPVAQALVLNYGTTSPVRNLSIWQYAMMPPEVQVIIQTAAGQTINLFQLDVSFIDGTGAEQKFTQYCPAAIDGTLCIIRLDVAVVHVKVSVPNMPTATVEVHS